MKGDFAKIGACPLRHVPDAHVCKSAAGHWYATRIMRATQSMGAYSPKGQAVAALHATMPTDTPATHAPERLESAEVQTLLRSTRAWRCDNHKQAQAQTTTGKPCATEEAISGVAQHDITLNRMLSAVTN